MTTVVSNTVNELQTVYTKIAFCQAIFIEPNEWFVPIEKAYPSLLSEYNRLELDKTLDNTSRNEQYVKLFSLGVPIRI